MKSLMPYSKSTDKTNKNGFRKSIQNGYAPERLGQVLATYNYRWKSFSKLGEGYFVRATFMMSR